MNILSYIFPQQIYKTSSSYNKYIEVTEFWGSRSLFVNNILQTGVYDFRIFDTAFNTFNISELSVNKALILGVGGGYIINKLKKLFPHIHITAVDIDKKIIEIALRYFYLDSVQNISLETCDASEFVKNNKYRYDCIFIDIYIGDEIPEFLESNTFLSNVKKILKKDGWVLINYQGTESYRIRKDSFTKMLNSIFPTVRDSQIERNTFFFLTNI